MILDQVEMVPGTIVLQYVDQPRHFVGVVLPDTAVSLLKEKERRAFAAHQGDGDITVCHVLLVLGCFDVNEGERSLFDDSHEKFPWYIFGEKRFARAETFKEELALFRAHHARPGLSDNVTWDLRKRSFPLRHEETLELLLFVQDYLNSKSDDELLSHGLGFSERGDIVLDTLKQLFPRDGTWRACL